MTPNVPKIKRAPHLHKTRATESHTHDPGEGCGTSAAFLDLSALKIVIVTDTTLDNRIHISGLGLLLLWSYHISQTTSLQYQHT